MSDPNKAELRRLAEAVCDDYWSPDVGMTTAETMYACAAAPGVVLSLLDECDRKDAELNQCRNSLQHMIDQTTPLEPVPGDPMWSRRIQLDQVKAERDAALAEIEAIRGLLVQCTLSAETLRTDSLGHAQHCGFGDRMVSAMRRLSGVKPGHGLGSRDYPSQAAAIEAAVSLEAIHG